MGFSKERPDLSNGRLRLPFREDGPFRFEPPRTSCARKAVTLGGPMGGQPHGYQAAPPLRHLRW